MSKRPRKMSNEQVAKINELHTSGMNAYQIAKTLNIPPGVAKYHIDRNKLSLLKQNVADTPRVNAMPPAPRNNTEGYYKQELDKVYMQEITKLKLKNKFLVEVISQL